MDGYYLNMKKRQSPKNVRFKSKGEVKLIIYLLVNQCDGKRQVEEGG